MGVSVTREMAKIESMSPLSVQVDTASMRMRFRGWRLSCVQCGGAWRIGDDAVARCDSCGRTEPAAYAIRQARERLADNECLNARARAMTDRLETK